MCHGFFFCVQWVKVRGVCSYCSYCWNWWPSLFKHSFHDYNETWKLKNITIDTKSVTLKHYTEEYNNKHRDVTSARSCNKVGHLFWFTILVQHETNDVILYIHSVHKHWGNSFQRQNYKMRLKQRSLNWINSMQVKKILFTNVFFFWSLCWLNMFPSMVFPKHLYFSGLLT
jgi:hypothetical protein